MGEETPSLPGHGPADGTGVAGTCGRHDRHGEATSCLFDGVALSLELALESSGSLLKHRLLGPTPGLWSTQFWSEPGNPHLSSQVMRMLLVRDHTLRTTDSETPGRYPRFPSLAILPFLKMWKAMRVAGRRNTSGFVFACLF